jgi:hypothetical protein
MRKQTKRAIAVTLDRETRPAQAPRFKSQQRPGRRADSLCLLLVATAHLAPLLVVSPSVEIPLIDDWNHALSVHRLVETGQLRVSDWTATTLVAQVVWGALFTALFGFSFTILRVSTLVLSLIGSVALYGLCRQVGVSQWRSLVGALLLWGNPMMFGLSYTFMSDVPALSLQILATLWYVRGVQRTSDRALVVGSCFAALAFLVRHTGILLPLAVVGFGALDRWPRAALARRGLASAGLPALAVLGYGVWSRRNGLPDTQASFFETVIDTGPAEWAKGLLLAGYLLFYCGACLLPLALAGSVHGFRTLVTGPTARRRLLVGWICAVVGLALGFAALGFATSAYTPGMPYLLHGGMLQTAGLGPDNLMGDRAPVLNPAIRVVLTVLSAASLWLIGALLFRGAVRRRQRARKQGAADLLVLIALTQFAGLFAVSANLLNGTWLSFDRYLLPVLPPLIVLSLLAIRDIRLSTPLLAAGLAAFMLFSMAATHDWLAFNRQRWELGEKLVAEGVALEQIDAGMEWDGWHLYERSLACCPTPRTPPGPDRPFWTEIIAQATDSTWAVSSSPIDGYTIRERHTYDVWLRREPGVLHVLERDETGVTIGD